MIEFIGDSKINEFSMFKKIINNQSTLTIEQLGKEVDEFIQANMLETVFLYGDNGYQFTDKQLNTLTEYLYTMDYVAIMKLFQHPSAKPLIEVNNNKFLLDAMPFYLSKKFNHNSNIHKYYREKQEDSVFKKNLQNHFFNKIELLNAENIFRRKIKDKNMFFKECILDLFKEFSEAILQDLNLEQFTAKLERIELLKKHIGRKSSKKQIHPVSYNEFKQLFKQRGDQLLAQAMQGKAEEIKYFYERKPQDINTLILEKMNQDAANNKVENLPEEGKILVEEIRQHYNALANMNDLTDEEIFRINNLVNKRVSEVIYKYLKVDEEYRETMRHLSGKNTKELMLDSLYEIKKLLEEVRINKNEQNLSSLAATNKYLKNKP